MAKATRIGDGTTGTCNPGLCDECPHSRAGTNGTGSPDVFINGIAVHRRGDTGPTNCPHGGTFSSTSSSATVFANGKGITRIGDTTTCQVCGMTGSHVAGSPDVFVG